MMEGEIEIKSKVYKIISDLFYTSESELNENLGPEDLNAWDSLGQIQLITKLEQGFDIQLKIEEIMEMDSVKKIIEILNKRRLTG